MEIKYKYDLYKKINAIIYKIKLNLYIVYTRLKVHPFISRPQVFKAKKVKQHCCSYIVDP